jgi:hypothetical protein
MTARWDVCIQHRDNDAIQFFQQYLKDASRQVLCVCGAGFDAQSTEVAKRLAAATKRIRGFFIREGRPRPDTALVARADQNEQRLAAMIPTHTVERVAIFSQDIQAVIGGRNIVRAFNQLDLSDITDIFLDMTALSLGVSFPLARVMFERSKNGVYPNVHLVITTKSSVDDTVRSEIIGRPQFIPGFAQDANLEGESERTKLWLPQLTPTRTGALEIIHTVLQPGETCPIVPFPARNPRAVEELIEVYQGSINDPWRVDDRDFLFAAEDDPLDLYRTILRVDELRRATYASSGGSVTLLSPVGSKAMAAGALLAALERPLPVVYVETERYLAGANTAPAGDTGLVHLWLTGEVYPPTPV